MLQDFVVIDTVANLNPLAMDVNIYCSENPGSRTGFRTRY